MKFFNYLNESVKKKEILNVIKEFNDIFTNKKLFTGNCGMFAFALKKILLEKNIIKEKDVLFGFLIPNIDFDDADLIYSDFDIYHIILIINNKWYDGDGLIGNKNLLEISNEYDDNHPLLYHKKYKDDDVLKIIRSNTAWNTSWEEFYKIYRENHNETI